MSEETGIYGALAKARGQFGEITKNRKATVRMKSGGQYSYTYADLSDVFAAVDAALADNGICPIQTPVLQDGKWILRTTLAHESGETITGDYPILTRDGEDKGHPAQIWSAGFTFAKRYHLCGMLGVASEETVEGDHRAKLGNGEGPLDINDAFETGDGVRLPKGTKVPANATPRQKAEAAAEAIEAQFGEVKTTVGLNGVWNRNVVFIDKLAENHNDLYQSVFDAFHALMEKMGEPE